MKRMCMFVLVLALLLGVAACGTAQPAEPIETSTALEAAAAAPAKAEFERALQLYKYFSMTCMQVDREDSFARDGVTYYRITDPEYPTMDALALALSEAFSYEIMRDFLHRTMDGTALLYVTKEPVIGELYTCVGDRGANISSYSVGAVSENENKIVSKLTAVNFDGGTEETLLTQELVDGQWVFTEFPLAW